MQHFVVTDPSSRLKEADYAAPTRGSAARLFATAHRYVRAIYVRDVDGHTTAHNRDGTRKENEC